MILERNVFYLKFGKAKEVIALAKEAKKQLMDAGYKGNRTMVDLVGHSYTLVTEMEWENLAQMEDEMKKAFSDKNWQTWYQKFVPLVESSYREIFTILE